LLTGGGATFPHPIYARWIAEFQKLHPNIEIEYNAIGSGAGIREITAGVYDFGASDGPMDDAQLKEYRAKRGVAILHFPTVTGRRCADLQHSWRDCRAQIHAGGARRDLSR
jgi:phosphate transport system substrate-binding protein